MNLLVAGVLVLTILFAALSWRIGKRKKTIDQFESDARIFLVFLIIVSFYLLFLCVSLTYIVVFVFVPTGKIGFLFISLYLLIPPFLGILLYALLPWIWGRTLHVREVPPPEKVKELAHLLRVPVPAVRTTPLKTTPPSSTGEAATIPPLSSRRIWGHS